MVQVSTYQYMPVRTDLGITDVSTYCLVPICGFLYGLVSTSVRTGSYQYIPSCTTLYQGYRIPDDVSEHGTDMYIDVHELTYRHEHVCTLYVHVHIFM